MWSDLTHPPSPHESTGPINRAQVKVGDGLVSRDKAENIALRPKSAYRLPPPPWTGDGWLDSACPHQLYPNLL